MGARARKISQPKLEREGATFDPQVYQSVRKKSSGHNIPLRQSVPDHRNFLKSKRSLRRDPSELKERAG
jgi:hypothetical protein